MLNIGSLAPDFELPSTAQKQIKLSDLKGKKVVLVFYPANWSPVCGDELTLFNTALRLIQTHNALIFGISVDSIWSHLAYKKQNNLQFELLADFEPKGQISKFYKAYDETLGQSTRTIYIIDEQGVVRWAETSPIDINPGVNGVLDFLEGNEPA